MIPRWLLNPFLFRSSQLNFQSPLSVCELTVFTSVWQTEEVSGGISLETYLRWVGSPSTALHEGSTPHRGLMTKTWSLLFLQSLLGSESRRHHQSSQRYKRKARAGEDSGALGGRDSKAHPVPRQRGSRHTGSSSGTCGFEDQEWVQNAQLLSKSFGTMAMQW